MDGKLTAFQSKICFLVIFLLWLWFGSQAPMEVTCRSLSDPVGDRAVPPGHALGAQDTPALPLKEVFWLPRTPPPHLGLGG